MQLAVCGLGGKQAATGRRAGRGAGKGAARRPLWGPGAAGPSAGTTRPPRAVGRDGLWVIRTTNLQSAHSLKKHQPQFNLWNLIILERLAKNATTALGIMPALAFVTVILNIQV